MSISNLRGATKWALMVALGMGAGAVALAQQDEAEDNGRVVQIGRADDQEANSAEAQAENELNPGSAPAELPKYWIGLRGGAIGDDDPLRAHVDLPANQGLLVVEVVPDSPAAKAGLKKYDILLRANDAELNEMTQLVDTVIAEGEKKAQITLDIMRHGERETVYVTPEERPATAQLPQEGSGFGGGAFGGELPEGFPRDLFGQLQGRGQMPFNFRNFGPGVIVGGGGIANVPNGVSVSVHKEDGQPARITVKRGDETWEVVGDDAESLKKLPEDLRPFVEQMLRGGSPFGGGFQMPNIDRQFGRGFGDEQLQDRLEQMERQINELLERVDPNHKRADQQAEQEEAK
jgi:membrane-associated protease RseP (regulator of RpoE activity)